MTPPILALSVTAANALVASIGQGLLIVLAVTLCLHLVPRIPAAARSLIWTGAFVLILALPLLPNHHSPGTVSVAVNPRWSLALASLWLTFSLVRAAKLILSALTLRRLARTATLVPNPVSLASEFTLCTSLLVDRPSVVGFFSRRILLPPALYTSLTPTELEHVLLHETEHLRRRDDWTNLLQKLALVLIPLNPVLLWVERRLCLERELACDDRVLRSTGTPRAYATCLTHLAEHSLLHRSLTLTLGFFERQSELTRRVHRILLAPHQGMSERQTLAATSVLFLVLAGGSLELTRVPQLIRFASPSIQSAQLQPNLPSAEGPAFRPATFRTSDLSTRPTYVNAVMPVSTPLPQRSPAKLRITHIFHPRPRRTSPKRVLQADFTYGAAPLQHRLIFATATYTRVTYTVIPAVAVAVPSGWIIFNL